MTPPPPRSTLFPYTTLFRSITGGGGFIGSHLAEGHLKRGDQVWSLDTGMNLKVRHLLDDPKFHYVKDRKSTRLNSSHLGISYAVFCLKKKQKKKQTIKQINR